MTDSTRTQTADRPLRTYLEVVATADDQPAFASKTEYFAWKNNWCARCQQPAEVAWREKQTGLRTMAEMPEDFPAGCSIIEAAAFSERTPVELIEQDRRWSANRYRCSEFRGDV